MPLRIATGRQGILWHGAFFLNHSLALVNRELALALLETDRFDIGIQHYEPMTFDATSEARFAPLGTALRARPSDPKITVRHLWPPDFSRPETERLVLIQPWEFGSLPRAWVSGIMESVDEVWVPSNFVREEYLTSGVPASRVFVVPNGVNTSRFHPGVAPMDLPTQKRFRFLFVGGTIARKGIDVLLDSYTRAFTSDDDVSLVIKDFGTKSFYAGQDAAALIAALQAKPRAPEIIHLTEDITDDAVAGLYSACDCLVHPYRGEGYGLPIAEAMACGKPTVITGYGAALDFANDRNSFLIPATVVRLAEKRIGDMETVDHPYWAEPDRDALAATLRRIHDRPDEAGARGAQASKDIASRHTWTHAARIAADRLQMLAPAVRVSKTLSVPAASYEARKQEAIRQTRAANWHVALEQLEACLADNPDDWDLVNARGVAMFRMGPQD